MSALRSVRLRRSERDSTAKGRAGFAVDRMGLLLNDHALRHILPNACGYARLIGKLTGTKDMDRFRPKYVTFDCHGTLINFQMAEAARDLFGRLLDGPRMDEFIKNFRATASTR